MLQIFYTAVYLQADMDGLERCPFCDFATIMDTSPEENKVFQCRDSECGKESCRLCKEISHIPLRCEEVEKDAEVRKRTYIENKMTEALIRKCWKCSKPFLKSDGCNKMTCECGAQMCYLCRKPVRDYHHFYGQGGHATATQTCPLWSNSDQIHETEVARGALEAKTEMDQQEPDVHLKHDPTLGVNMEKAAMEERERNDRANRQQRERAAIAGVEGLENILGHDANDHERIVREQMQIEQMIRQGRNNDPRGRFFQQPGPVAGPAWQQQHNWGWGNAAANAAAAAAAAANAGPPLFLDHHHHQQQLVPEIHRGWHEGFVNRMGELLQMREVERRRHRMIRQRERQALEDFHQHVNRAPAAVVMNQQQRDGPGLGPARAPAAHPAAQNVGGAMGNLPPPAVPNVLPNNQPGGMWHHRPVPQGPPHAANQQHGMGPFQVGVVNNAPKRDATVLRAPILQAQPPHAPLPAHQNPAVPFHQVPAAAAGPPPPPPPPAPAAAAAHHPWVPGAPRKPTYLAEQRRRMEKRQMGAAAATRTTARTRPFEMREPMMPPRPPPGRAPPAAALGAPPPPPANNKDELEALLDTL